MGTVCHLEQREDLSPLDAPWTLMLLLEVGGARLVAYPLLTHCSPFPPALQYAGPASAEPPLPMSRHETSPTTVQPASNHRPNACCFCWCCCCSCSW